MSNCNHKEAIQVFQKAKDIGALHKLLTKVLELDPAAISRAWHEVDLEGHLCQVCKKSVLEETERGSFKCGLCSSEVRR